MNFWRRKRDLRCLSELPTLTKSTICDELRPFAVPLGLTFTETEICFPQPLCIEQKAILISAFNESPYPKSIPYNDIVIMDAYDNKLKIILRSGHIFHFVKDRPVWLVDNPLNYGEPSAFTVWWWSFSGWVTRLWWKITRRNRRTQRE